MNAIRRDAIRCVTLQTPGRGANSRLPTGCCRTRKAIGAVNPSPVNTFLVSPSSPICSYRTGMRQSARICKHVAALTACNSSIGRPAARLPPQAGCTNHTTRRHATGGSRRRAQDESGLGAGWGLARTRACSRRPGTRLAASARPNASPCAGGGASAAAPQQPRHSAPPQCAPPPVGAQ